MWLSEGKIKNYWGIAGLLGFTAVLLTSLSTDSFAVPNMWVVFGFATAAVQVYSQPPSIDHSEDGKKIN
jgi:hypothetical protein